MIYRKSLITENRLFFPENIFYEDNAVGPALVLAASKIVKIDDELYYYRIWDQSTVQRKNDFRFFQRLDTIVMFLDHVKRLGLYEKYKREADETFLRIFYKNSILGAFIRFNPVPYREISKLMKDVFKYMDKDDVDKYVACQTSFNRMVINASNINPRIGHLIYAFRILAGRLYHKIKK